MPIVEIIIILLVIGVAVWAINQYLAAYIAAPFLKLINIVAIVGTIIWLVMLLLGAFGVNVWHYRLGR
jgi:cation transporter-like permease